MGMLFDLLPLLDAWKYQVISFPSERLPARGEKHIVFAEKELGWIIAATVGAAGANAELTKVSIKMDDWEVSDTFKNFYEAGMFQGISIPYITRYDTILDAYVASVEFPFPTPYKKLLSIKLTAPSQNEIWVNGGVEFIRIKTEPGMKEKFIASLQKVLGVSEIIKALKPLE